MLVRLWRNCNLVHCWCSCYGKCYGSSSKKLKIELPYDPAIPLLGIYPKELKTSVDIYTPIFIAALFTMAKRWKQPRYSVDDWINNVVYIDICILWYIYRYIDSTLCVSIHIYIYTVHIYIYTHNGKLLGLKMKEILPHATTWMNFEDIMLMK